jgi:crotonobetainyl-CoA:carnitine CoA-transferase CaiB-like acyl-CoA transferase
MGQGIMRAHDLHDVPDPLRSSLRSLLAVAGGRYAFIPAAIAFTPDSVGQRVDASLVLADVRLGTVLWRTIAYASGETPERALVNALEATFPYELSQ